MPEKGIHKKDGEKKSGLLKESIYIIVCPTPFIFYSSYKCKGLKSMIQIVQHVFVDV